MGSDIVWHYTSLDSFFNIVRSGRIWAFSAHDMHDKLEFKYGASLVYDVAKSMAEDDPVNIERYWLFARDFWKKQDHNQVFVFSTTPNPDSAYQWKHYADNSKGVCFSLSTSNPLILAPTSPGGNVSITSLFATPMLNGWHPVIYDRDQQQRLIRRAIEEGPGLARNGGRFSVMENLFKPIKTVTAQIKQSSFQPEQEIRYMMSVAPKLKSKEIGPETSRRQYIELASANFEKGWPYITPLAIQEVRLGEKAGSSVSKVQRLLDSVGIENCRVMRQRP